MDDSYFSKLSIHPAEKAVRIVEPSQNLTISSKCYHVNSKTMLYRMANSLVELQKSKDWIKFHIIVGSIPSALGITQVGLTEDEFRKLTSRTTEEPIEIVADLLEDNIGTHIATEVFLQNSSKLNVGMDEYNIVIDFSSGDFHRSNIMLGLIGTRFKIKVI